MTPNTGKYDSQSYKGQNRQRRRHLGSSEKMKLRDPRALECLCYRCPVLPLECKERSQCHLGFRDSYFALYEIQLTRVGLTRPAKSGHHHSLNLLALLRRIDTTMLTHIKNTYFTYMKYLPDDPSVSQQVNSEERQGRRGKVLMKHEWRKSGNNISCCSTSYIHGTRSHPSVISFNGRRRGQPLHVQFSSLHISVAFKTTSAISSKHGLPNWQQTIKVNAFTICPLDSFTATEIVLLWPWVVGA